MWLANTPMNQTEAVDALSALAQATRLEVFRTLVQAGPSGLAAGRIAQRLAVRRNTLSSHLGILLGAGLVEKRREGRTIIYGARYQRMRELLTYLLEDCCGGERAICAPLLEAMAC